MCCMLYTYLKILQIQIFDNAKIRVIEAKKIVEFGLKEESGVYSDEIPRE